MDCASVEEDNDFVLPANATAVLNCTLLQNSSDSVTWFLNDKEMKLTEDNTVEGRNLKVEVGEFYMCVFMYGKAVAVQISCSVSS